jgi:transcriptional regulator with XRE-family HTH domain
MMSASCRTDWGMALPRYGSLRDCHRLNSASSIQRVMPGSHFHESLRREFDARLKRNPRYSLRAFAEFLATDHSTLSQIFRGKRRIPVSQLRRWGKKLAMTPEEVAVYVAEQHVPDQSLVSRQEQLRHWTAEALAIATDHTHWQIVRVAASRGFRPDSRWIAGKIGVTVDQVNVALSRLLRLRLLEIGPAGKWKSCLYVDEKEFHKRALFRVRELAAEDGIELRRLSRKSSN